MQSAVAHALQRDVVFALWRCCVLCVYCVCVFVLFNWGCIERGGSCHTSYSGWVCGAEAVRLLLSHPALDDVSNGGKVVQRDDIDVLQGERRESERVGVQWVN